MIVTVDMWTTVKQIYMTTCFTLLQFTPLGIFSSSCSWVMNRRGHISVNKILEIKMFRQRGTVLSDVFPNGYGYLNLWIKCYALWTFAVNAWAIYISMKIFEEWTNVYQIFLKAILRFQVSIVNFWILQVAMVTE